MRANVGWERVQVDGFTERAPNQRFEHFRLVVLQVVVGVWQLPILGGSIPAAEVLIPYEVGHSRRRNRVVHSPNETRRYVARGEIVEPAKLQLRSLREVLDGCVLNLTTFLVVNDRSHRVNLLLTLRDRMRDGVHTPGHERSVHVPGGDRTGPLIQEPGLKWRELRQREVDVSVGDEVVLSVKDGKIIVELANKVRGRYNIEHLVAEMPADYQVEETDWGPPAGQEEW